MERERGVQRERNCVTETKGERRAARACCMGGSGLWSRKREGGGKGEGRDVFVRERERKRKERKRKKKRHLHVERRGCAVWAAKVCRV